MDSIDQAILNCIQQDCSLSLAEISDRVGLSSTPCWRRIQKLESAGIIRKRVALLDAQKLNLGITVFVSVRTNQHSQDWLEEFSSAVFSLPEVVEFYRMSGDVDYLLKVVVPDIAAFDEVYKKLIESVDLLDVSSSFAMERIKSTTATATSLRAGESLRTAAHQLSRASMSPNRLPEEPISKKSS